SFRRGRSYHHPFLRWTGNHTANPASATVNATHPTVIPEPSGSSPNHSRAISDSVPPSPLDPSATLPGTAHPSASRASHSGPQRRTHLGSRPLTAAAPQPGGWARRSPAPRPPAPPPPAPTRERPATPPQSPPPPSRWRPRPYGTCSTPWSSLPHHELDAAIILVRRPGTQNRAECDAAGFARGATRQNRGDGRAGVAAGHHGDAILGDDFVAG